MMPADLTASTVAKLENGSMALSADYIMQIAQALGVHPAEILLENFGQRVSAVPLLNEEDALDWREAVKKTAVSLPIPTHLEQLNLFVVQPAEISVAQLSPGRVHLVIDPDQRKVEDGSSYMILKDGGPVCYFRFIAADMVLAPLSGDPACSKITIGLDAFTVIGRIVYLGRDV